MRRFFTVICAAAAILSSAACSKFSEAENVTQVSEGKLVPVTLSVELPSVSVETRTLTAYTEMEDYEKTINSVQYLVYDANGDFLYYYKATSSTDVPSFICKSGGSYRFFAFVNYDQDLSSLTDINNIKTTTYEIKGTEKTTGFPMFAQGVYTISDNPQTITLTAKHQMVRVSVSYIKNNLPADLGELKVKALYLMNVPSMLETNGTSLTRIISGIKYYNAFGRNVTSDKMSKYDNSNEYYSHIIDGSTYPALLPDLTYYALGATLKNGETANLVPAHFYTNSSVASGALYEDYTCNALVVIAEIRGETQYYAVAVGSTTIGGKDKNTAYQGGECVTYGITINGFGATEPWKSPVSTLSASPAISVASWTGGVRECQ